MRSLLALLVLLVTHGCLCGNTVDEGAPDGSRPDSGAMASGGGTSGGGSAIGGGTATGGGGGFPSTGGGTAMGGGGGFPTTGGGTAMGGGGGFPSTGGGTAMGGGGGFPSTGGGTAMGGGGGFPTTGGGTAMGGGGGFPSTGGGTAMGGGSAMGGGAPAGGGSGAGGGLPCSGLGGGTGSVSDGGCVSLQSVGFPIAWWDGDELRGNQYCDRFRKHNANIFGSVPQVPGRVGLGMEFNSSSDVLEVPHDVALMPNAMTIEVWAKPTTLLPAYTRILGKGFDDIEDPTAWVFGIGGFGGIYFGLFQNSTQTFIDGMTPLTLNAWNHLAATWDGATMRIYLNGVQQPEMKPFSGATHQIGDLLRIGRGSKPKYPFSGTLDEVTFFNRALSPTEISAIYNAGGFGKCK